MNGITISRSDTPASQDMGQGFQIACPSSFVASRLQLKGNDFDVYSGANLVLSVRASYAHWYLIEAPGTPQLSVLPRSRVSVILAFGEPEKANSLGALPSLSTAYFPPADARTICAMLPRTGVAGFIGSTTAGASIGCGPYNLLQGNRAMSYNSPSMASSLRTSSRTVLMPAGQVFADLSTGPLNLTTAAVTTSISVAATLLTDQQMVCLANFDPSVIGYVYVCDYFLRQIVTADLTSVCRLGFALLDPADVVGGIADVDNSQALVITDSFSLSLHNMLTVTADGFLSATSRLALFAPSVELSGSKQWYAVVIGGGSAPTAGTIAMHMFLNAPVDSLFDRPL